MVPVSLADDAGEDWRLGQSLDALNSKDRVFTKNTSDADVDRLIRNAYKVLLTRGMVGTVLYSTDPETRELLGALVSADRQPTQV